MFMVCVCFISPEREAGFNGNKIVYNLQVQLTDRYVHVLYSMLHYSIAQYTYL